MTPHTHVDLMLGMTKPPHALIFDIDGTLWDASDASANGWNKCLQQLDIKQRITAGELAAVSGMPFVDCMLEIFTSELLEQHPDLEQKLSDHEIETVAQHGGKLYEGVNTHFPTLAKHYDLCLVSNCQDRYLDVFLEYSGLKDFLKGVDCHGRSGLPKGETLRKLIREHSIINTVYIGDTEADHDAADIAGIPFLYANYGFGVYNYPGSSFDSFGALAEYFLNQHQED